MVLSFGERWLVANNAVSSISHGLSLLLRSKTPTLPAQPLLTCSKYFLMLVMKTKYWILISLTILETQYWIHFVTDNPWPHQVWWCLVSKEPNRTVMLRLGKEECDRVHHFAKGLIGWLVICTICKKGKKDGRYDSLVIWNTYLKKNRQYGCTPNWYVMKDYQLIFCPERCVLISEKPNWRVREVVGWAVCEEIVELWCVN